MSDETVVTETTNNGIVNRLTSELFLGSLVAILSILTAVAAYQGALTDAQAGDSELKALKNLTESNTEYIFANQDIIYDYRLYDQYILTQDADEEQYYLDNFSEALSTSLEREEGPFDDAYYDAQFDTANELYTVALDFFDKTDTTGSRADRLQLIVLIFALGLSFAAWASLADEEGRLKAGFAVLAIVTSTGGILLYVQLLLSGTPA